jgi:hypothetical protein
MLYNLTTFRFLVSFVFEDYKSLNLVHNEIRLGDELLN